MRASQVLRWPQVLASIHLLMEWVLLAAVQLPVQVLILLLQLLWSLLMLSLLRLLQHKYCRYVPRKGHTRAWCPHGIHTSHTGGTAWQAEGCRRIQGSAHLSEQPVQDCTPLPRGRLCIHNAT